jgi:hypothetical protein
MNVSRTFTLNLNATNMHDRKRRRHIDCFSDARLPNLLEISS